MTGQALHHHNLQIWRLFCSLTTGSQDLNSYTGSASELEQNLRQSSLPTVY